MRIILFRAFLLSLLFTQAVNSEPASQSINLLPGFPKEAGSFTANGLFPKKAAWRALVCSRQVCSLVNTKLTTEINGGTLYVERPMLANNTLDNTLVYLAGIGQDNQPLETYFTPTKPREALDATAGSIGIAFEMPKQGITKIIPRWNRDKDEDRLNVYFEQGKKRQIVAYIPLSALSKSISIRDVLVWAGDLDGDGKLDLITRNTVDRAYPGVVEGMNDTFNKSLNLWLSSKANATQLVGLAASLDYYNYNWEE